MRCELTTQIPVSRVAVFAEMAWMERRPELGLLCRAARAQDNRITTAIVQSAPEKSASVSTAPPNRAACAVIPLA